MAFSFNSRSHAEQLNRLINEQKLYATLPHKLKKEVDNFWTSKTTKDKPELDRKFEE